MELALLTDIYLPFGSLQAGSINGFKSVKTGFSDLLSIIVFGARPGRHGAAHVSHMGVPDFDAFLRVSACIEAMVTSGLSLCSPESERPECSPVPGPEDSPWVPA
jgi:hypothetical protein